MMNAGGSISNRMSFQSYFLMIICVFPILSLMLLGNFNDLFLSSSSSISLMNGGGGTTTSNNLLEITLKNSKEGMKIKGSSSSTNDTSSTTYYDANADDTYKLAGLSCDRYGGPAKEIAQEMVYWQDIPTDAQFISPLKRSNTNTNNNINVQQQYLTFEPDHGGWNNIRMAMETIVVMAFAMGRTLVLPPASEMYLLQQKKHAVHGQQQSHLFTFSHFFNMNAIQNEHPGIDIISMQSYLEITYGHMYEVVVTTTPTTTNDSNNNNNDNHKIVSYPPNNRTNWDGASSSDLHDLYTWLRSVSYVPYDWDPDECLAVFPSTSSSSSSTEQKNNHNIDLLLHMKDMIVSDKPKFETYINNPVPVNGSTLDRMKESWADRSSICLYNQTMQETQYIHFPVDHALSVRLLTHFYTFVFFEDYRIDLWTKRFVRDHIRYIDEIQCAAARIVEKLRERIRRRDPITNPNGYYNAFHVRRGDFQYQKTRVDAKELLRMAKKKLPAGTSLYIATDEHSKSFFRPLMDYYHVMFMDDFIEDGTLHGINSNYFGMIDALVASRANVFYGCWFSTFTGYINRLRGYHADKDKLPGYEQGRINSYFYALEDRFDHMQVYYPIKKVFYAREFPTAWRLIDSTVNETIVQQPYL